MNIRSDLRLAVLAANLQVTEAQYARRMGLIRNPGPVGVAVVATLKSRWSAM